MSSNTLQLQDSERASEEYGSRLLAALMNAWGCTQEETERRFEALHIFRLNFTGAFYCRALGLSYPKHERKKMKRMLQEAAKSESCSKRVRNAIYWLLNSSQQYNPRRVRDYHRSVRDLLPEEVNVTVDTFCCNILEWERVHLEPKYRSDMAVVVSVEESWRRQEEHWWRMCG